MSSDASNGIFFDVRISPGASRSKVIGLYNESLLKISVQSPPVDGKANAALVEFLSELFSVAKKNVVIVKGETSRTKKIFIQGDKLQLTKVHQELLCAHS